MIHFSGLSQEFAAFDIKKPTPRRGSAGIWIGLVSPISVFQVYGNIQLLERIGSSKARRQFAAGRHNLLSFTFLPNTFHYQSTTSTRLCKSCQHKHLTRPSFTCNSSQVLCDILCCNDSFNRRLCCSTPFLFGPCSPLPSFLANQP